MLVACSLTLLLLCLGLTADLGNVYLEHRKMQSAADLAAAAVGTRLPAEDSAEAEAALSALAGTAAALNGAGPDRCGLSLEFFRADGQIYAVRLILTETVPRIFSGLYTDEESRILTGALAHVSRREAEEAGYVLLIEDA